MTKYIFGGLLSRFVESIHIQLTNKAVDVPMSKVFGQDNLLKLLNVFYGELFAICRPLNYFGIFMILKL